LSGLPLVSLLSAIAAALAAAIVPFAFGHLKPGYSHLRHTISELGETGSPVGGVVSYFGFLSTGLLVWLFVLVSSLSIPDDAREPVYLLALVGAAYVGGGIFRCDPGAPAFGSWRNTLHNILGALEYIGAAGAFVTLQRVDFWSPLSPPMTDAGGLVLICFWGVSFPHRYRGLLQRVAETTIFLGIVLMGWWLYQHASGAG